MKKEEKKSDRPFAYPQPTETDKQLKDQPEFIDERPNEYDDKKVSDTTGSDADRTGDQEAGRTGE